MSAATVEGEPPALHRYEALIGADTLAEIAERSRAADPLETIGILVGYRARDPEGCLTIVRALLHEDHEATRSTVRMEPEQRTKLLWRLATQYPDCLEVGWWHSHPGYTAFLSPTDVANTQRHFAQWYHLAIVYDNRADDFRIFKLSPDNRGYRPVEFLVVDTVDEKLLAALRGAAA